jgi:hypothetical protein
MTRPTPPTSLAFQDSLWNLLNLHVHPWQKPLTSKTPINAAQASEQETITYVRNNKSRFPSSKSTIDAIETIAQHLLVKNNKRQYTSKELSKICDVVQQNHDRLDKLGEDRRNTIEKNWEDIKKQITKHNEEIRKSWWKKHLTWLGKIFCSLKIINTNLSQQHQTTNVHQSKKSKLMSKYVEYLYYSSAKNNLPEKCCQHKTKMSLPTKCWKLLITAHNDEDFQRKINPLSHQKLNDSNRKLIEDLKLISPIMDQHSESWAIDTFQAYTEQKKETIRQAFATRGKKLTYHLTSNTQIKILNIKLNAMKIPKIPLKS